jgi:hypothetical protein
MPHGAHERSDSVQSDVQAPDISSGSIQEQVQLCLLPDMEHSHEHHSLQGDRDPEPPQPAETSSRAASTDEARAVQALNKAWLVRFGMLADSWDGWAKLHVEPLVAMQFYFFSEAGFALSKVYLATGLPFNWSIYCYITTVPILINIAVTMSLDLLMWRYGPQATKFKVYHPAGVIVTLMVLPTWYLGYIGPQATVPWRNRFKFVIVNIPVAILGHMVGFAGGHHGYHPAQPRATIFKPLYQAVVQSLKFTDSLTDLTLIGELLAQV